MLKPGKVTLRLHRYWWGMAAVGLEKLLVRSATCQREKEVACSVLIGVGTGTDDLESAP